MLFCKLSGLFIYLVISHDFEFWSYANLVAFCLWKTSVSRKFDWQVWDKENHKEPDVREPRQFEKDKSWHNKLKVLLRLKVCLKYT